MSRLIEPLRFRPLVKRAIWGGTRLHSALGKATDGFLDAAESWEICDLPGNQTVVESGDHGGRTLKELLAEFPDEILGRHAGCSTFPILIKFLDANQPLSVQLHPIEPVKMPDGSMRLGKAEAWVVIDALPESIMYIGLKDGVSESDLRSAIAAGDLSQCLHEYTPKPGDCIFLQPGTVHALGGGILVAEVQQPSDITYRLFDWNRVDSQGNPRELHVDVGMKNVNFGLGPVAPCVPRRLQESGRSEELIESEFFVIHRHFGPDTVSLPSDARMHLLIVIKGEAKFSETDEPLRLGQTLLVPAGRDRFEFVMSEDAVVLDAYLPDHFAVQ